MKRYLLIIALLACSCTSYDRQTCEPGMQIECDCPGTVKGVQICKDDGSGWSECNCPCQRDCTDRDCGLDPVCGELCGTCDTYETCSADGRCECLYAECGGTCCANGQVCAGNACCSPGCGARECGLDPVCGSSCGECLPDEDCSMDGQCFLVVPGPRLCAEPTSLNFGTLQIGRSSELSFNLENCGDADLSLMGVSFAADSSPDFDLLNLPVFPQTLAPGASLDVQVRYAPQSAGPDEGGVEIFSDDIASDPVTHLTGTIALSGSGTGYACQIHAWPMAVTFGGVVSGQSDTINLGVSNVGDGPCTFHGAQITTNSADAEFSIVSAPAAGTVIDPGGDAMIQLQYAPVNLGIDEGVLTLSTSDPEGDIQVTLAGEGVTQVVCDLQVTPANVQFGTVKPGRTAVGSVTLTNAGNAACHVTNLELRTGVSPGDFDFQSAPTLPLTLNRSGMMGSTYVIEVAFAPTQTGLHEAHLWLTSDDPDLQQSGGFGCNPPPLLGQACVPLEGLAEESSIEVLPPQLDFGVVGVGCNSPDLEVTVYNLGGAALNVTGIETEDPQNPDFEVVSAPSLPHPLPGGGSFDVQVRCHPQGIGPRRGTLAIRTDDPVADLLAVPLLGEGTDIPDRTDIFYQHTDVKTDVLFVVDNSGSMGEEQAALAQYFPDFIDRAVLLDADFHVGVIAVEVNDEETGLGSPPRDIYPGVLVYAPGRPKIITPATPDLENAFAENVALGTCCADEQEAGLQAAWMALSQPLIDDPAANAGFLRGDAKLYVVCISDDPDQSMGSTDFYADFFESLKGPLQSEWIKLSAICGDVPDGCTGPTGTAGAGPRYIDVAIRTGGIFESICTTDWTQTMQNLATDAFSTVREFPLTSPADPATIGVTVDGPPVPQASCPGCPDGWTYYPDINSVYFGDDVVPAPGARIDVSYTAACL